jgi:formylglycine-generating enzyme required for sulfatase activity
MIWVEPGTFTMGAPLSEPGRGIHDQTESNVTISKGFYMGKYEVTQAQYEAVMTGNTDGLSATPSTFNGYPNRPIESVSWNNLQLFLARINNLEQQAGRLPNGWEYALPTEAQWEYACRAGTTTAYSVGSTISAIDANFVSSGLGETRDVGQYPPNPWGFYDMHGNVWELVEETLLTNYKVKRGGSFINAINYLRSAHRDGSVRDYSNDRSGFRLVLREIE